MTNIIAPHAAELLVNSLCSLHPFQHRSKCPYHYLLYLFETLPNIDLNNKEEINKVLPWSTDLPSRCRVPKKSEVNKK
ncbi:hypothetical protein COE51_16045 [Bacillus pseudomycoides]|nr:hypothetical protein COE51_16045 [Bacillus pseudomycoides]